MDGLPFQSQQQMQKQDDGSGTNKLFDEIAKQRILLFIADDMEIVRMWIRSILFWVFGIRHRATASAAELNLLPSMVVMNSWNVLSTTSVAGDGDGTQIYEFLVWCWLEVPISECDAIQWNVSWYVLLCIESQHTLSLFLKRSKKFVKSNRISDSSSKCDCSVTKKSQIFSLSNGWTTFYLQTFVHFTFLTSVNTQMKHQQINSTLSRKPK